MKGIKIPMSKYYRHQIFTEDERDEQVLIVTDTLNELRSEEISEYGHQWYNTKQSKLKKETERRFKKKIKKRIVD